MVKFDPRPVARKFWKQVGRPEPFPRQLRGSIAISAPVAVVSMPRLTLASAWAWLGHHGAKCGMNATSRRVRGLLVANRGHGFIFLDGTMPEDEERLTLAHELAHFLYHYHAPRATALAILGRSIAPVLDGDRPATAAERFMSAIRDAPLGLFTHALDRREDGLPTSQILKAETEADLIAFELLAPSDRVSALSQPGAPRRDALQDVYGLPPWAAAAWARWIDARHRPDALIARLEDHRRRNRG